MWYGFDPGSQFGVARIDEFGRYQSATMTSTQDALEYVQPDCAGLGIDSVLWWSRSKGGGRRADMAVRADCCSGGGHSGTVSPINSLMGAMFVPAYLLIRDLRERFPEIRITEAHPKALLHALRLPVSRPRHDEAHFRAGWTTIADLFGLTGAQPRNEHERDAIVAALSAREGYSGRWPTDFARLRASGELALDDLFRGPVNYFWPLEVRDELEHARGSK
jgi:hypothetical protein